MTPLSRRAAFDPPLWVLLSLTLLFGAALWLRLLGTGWDGWSGQHPDERHLLFVASDMLEGLRDWQGRMSDLWFSPDSPLNPRAKERWFVYGEFPVLIMALWAHLTEVSGWGDLMELGRLLTTVVEASTIPAVFLLSLRLTANPGAALLAAALYAAAPTPLQLTNFYTVDAWLMALSTWALVPLLALATAAHMGAAIRSAALAGVLIGLAAACKVTSVALLAPALLAVLFLWRGQGWVAALMALLIGALAVFLAFRLANPFSFSGPGFWGMTPAPAMLDDYAELQRMADDPGPPPNWQWIAGYPLWAFLRDFALFGPGPVLSLLLLARLRWPGWRGQGRDGSVIGAMLLGALAAQIIGGFLFWVWMLRYFAPAIPLIAVAGAPVLALLLSRRAYLTLGMLLALALWWGSGMVILHQGPNPRITASEWMRRLPPGTVVAHETDWDEVLPVAQHRGDIPRPGPFHEINLALTHPEDPEMAMRLAAFLAKADYLVMGSGRQSDVMPRLPERFPVVSRYYTALFSGALCFTEVFSDDPGYPLPFWRLDDRFAQEPWRVYDHPVTRIWRKSDCFSEEKAAELLSAGAPL